MTWEWRERVREERVAMDVEGREVTRSRREPMEGVERESKGRESLDGCGGQRSDQEPERTYGGRGERESGKRASRWMWRAGK